MSSAERVTRERLDDLDAASRREWVIAATEVLIQIMPGSGVILMQARGFEEFLKHAKVNWEGHGFRFEDYRTAWDRINLTAERLKNGKGLGRIEKRLPGLAQRKKQAGVA